MSLLSFETKSANMLDPYFFGFGALLSSPEPEVGFSETLITLADPGTGAVVSLVGSFDASSEWSLLASPVEQISLRAADGGLLFDWSGLPVTLADFFVELDPVLLMRACLAGDDTVQGSVEPDFLFADLPDWHVDLTVPDPLIPGGALAISADGSTLAGVVWRTVEAQGRRDIVLIDPATGAQRLMSTGDGPQQAGTSALNPSLTRDGRLLVFRTDDPDLVDTTTVPTGFAVVARDTVTGTVTLVSSSAQGVPAQGNCEAPAVSADGSCVVFTSPDRMLMPDSDALAGVRQVYAKQLASGAVELISSNAQGEPAQGDSFGAAVSLDGRFVAFASYARNLVPEPVPDTGANIFVKDVRTGEVRFVAPLGNGAFLPEPDAIGLAISLDGRVVAFSSAAPGLVPEDTNNAPDVFIARLATGEILRASVDEFGAQAPLGAGSVALALSGDGACLAFHTRAGDLVAPGSAEWGNVYLRDFDAGVLYRVSAAGASNAWTPVAMAADALTLAFTQTPPVSGPDGSANELVVASLHGLGQDVVAGGGGDDLYFAEVGDLIVERPGEGEDTVVTVWPSWTLSDDLENLFYGGHGFFSGVGNAQANLLTGGSLDDTLVGKAGNDSFEAGGGHDVIDGGDGRDTTFFDASITGFSLQGRGASLVVEDRIGRLGSDLLVAVERLDFTDMDVNLTVQAAAAALDPLEFERLCELYVGFFGRVPASDGLAYWIGQRADGRALDSIAEDFHTAGSSPELRTYTGYWDFAQDRPLDDAAFVRVVYRNVLGREGLDPGVAYWAGQLTEGDQSRGSLVGAMLDAAHGLSADPDWGWVARLLDDRTVMSVRVAVEWGLNYADSPQQAIEKGMAIAGAVRELPNPAFPGIPVKIFDFDAAVALIGIDPGAIQLQGL